MAVPTETLSDRYDCNGSNQAFPITFEYLSSDNIAVQLYDGSLGTYATLVEDTDYTLANDTVTTVATYAAKYDIIIQLDPDLTQLTDWVNNDKFTSDSWENAVDKLTLISKMLQDQIDRCVRGPDGDASLDWKLSEGSVDRAGSYLHFNSVTGAIEAVGVLTASVTATAFAQTLLDDTSISAFLSTLEFSAFAQTLATNNAGDAPYRGYMNLAMTAIATTSVPTFTGDVEVNGTLVSFSTESGTNWAGIGASSDVWVYVTSSGTVLYSTAAPAWDSAKGGWYNSTSRAVAWIRKDSGNAYRYKHFLPKEQSAQIVLEETIEIGDWDMAAVSVLSVSHELQGTAKAGVRKSEATIRGDSDNNPSHMYPLTSGTDSADPTLLSGMIKSFGDFNITLYRRTGGAFDNAGYNETSYNRGWVMFSLVVL